MNRRDQTATRIRAEIVRQGHGPCESGAAIGSDDNDTVVPHHRVVITHAPAAEFRTRISRAHELAAAAEADWAAQDPAGGPAGPWTAAATDGVEWVLTEGGHTETTRTANRREISDLVAIMFGSPPRAGRPWAGPATADAIEGQIASVSELYRTLPRDARLRADAAHTAWAVGLRQAGSPPTRETSRDLWLTQSAISATAGALADELCRDTDDGRVGWRPAPERPARIADWLTEAPGGRETIAFIAATVAAFNWRRPGRDTLRALYMKFVPKSERRAFGEFYTPDWLAARLAAEVVDEAWIETACRNLAADDHEVPPHGVLDPACGSGTLLCHAAVRIARQQTAAGQNPGDAADAAAALVHGIDINPLAAEMASANILRALPGAPANGLRDIQVVCGDALMAANAPTGLFDAGEELRTLTPGGREIILPAGFGQTGDPLAEARRLLKTALTARAGTPAGDGVDSLRRAAAHEDLSDWPKLAASTARLRMLSRRKVDRILSNPPWTALKHITEPARRRTLEAFARTSHARATSQQCSHIDLSSLFIGRCRALYLHDHEQDPAAWIVSRSAIAAGNWAPFRATHTALAQTIDLAELEPFGHGHSHQACVLMDGRPVGEESAAAARATAAGPKEAQRSCRTGVPNATIRIEAAISESVESPSGYANTGARTTFRHGAAMTPSVVTQVARVEETADPERVLVTTVASRKPPWNTVDPIRADVPKAWVLPSYRGETVRAYSVTTPTRLVAPLDAGGRLSAAAALDEDGWNTLDRTYRRHRGTGQRTPKTLLERLNFQNDLARQLPLDPDTERRTVLYPGAGLVMRAARIPAGSAVAEGGLYWYAAPTAEEAAYLVVLLNAGCLREAYRRSGTSARGFHLGPWAKIPIPRFDPAVALHRETAGLCLEAERIAAETAAAAGPTPQIEATRLIHAALADAGVADAVDAAARRIVPTHAARARVIGFPA